MSYCGIYSHKKGPRECEYLSADWLRRVDTHKLDPLLFILHTPEFVKCTRKPYQKTVRVQTPDTPDRSN